MFKNNYARTLFLLNYFLIKNKQTKTHKKIPTTVKFEF